MVEIQIHEQACRGCRMCIEICPTDVLVFNETNERAQVKEKEDCIACLSCAYSCPSGAITHTDYPAVKNFYRDIEFCKKMEKFL